MRRIALEDLIPVVRFQLYEWVTGHGLSSMSAELIAEKIGANVTGSFVRTALEQFEDLGDLKFEAPYGGINVLNSPLPAKLTPQGIRIVEAELKKPESKISKYVLGGLQVFSSVTDTYDIPASDRLVDLNHNSPEYIDVSQKFEAAINAIEAINIPEDKAEARKNILIGLKAARSLWDATQLKAIQLKIGILMAAEDAREFVADTMQRQPVSLLVEAIKSIIKLVLGMHL